jgi:hypothetical protein
MAGSKKAAGVRKLFKASVPGFREAVDPADHPTARPRRSSRRDSPPRCWCRAANFGRLDVSRVVDVERAPYPSVASRLKASNSNTLNLVTHH